MKPTIEFRAARKAGRAKKPKKPKKPAILTAITEDAEIALAHKRDLKAAQMRRYRFRKKME